MSTALEWLSSPSKSPWLPGFPVTPRQERVAEIFGVYAVRFVLCHEMGHAIGGQSPVATVPIGEKGADEVDLLRWSQDQEIMADRLGLELQLRSIPDGSQAINALASAVYMTHAMELLNLRLMLLAKLIDFTRWQTKLTHPPLLLRYARLAGVAGQLVDGATEGLHSLHDQLAALNNEIMGETGRQQEEIEETMASILAEEARRATQAADPPAAVRDRMLHLFQQSPLGVLNALDAQLAPGAERNPAGETLAGRLVKELPPEFTRFLELSKAERADVILRIPSKAGQI